MTAITKEIIERVESHRWAFTDPCIICGVKFIDCPHDLVETAHVATVVRKMSKAEKEKILRGS